MRDCSEQGFEKAFTCKECGDILPVAYESMYKPGVCEFCDKEHYQHDRMEESDDVTRKD